jgi:protein-S-isoprenylcysteine O-methyltransferase Ste14
MITEKLIYNILLCATFIISALVFIALFFFNAPYGRFTSKGWGLRINPKIGWFIMESPAFFVIIICFFAGNRTGLVPFVFLFLWLVHYFQRTFIYSLLIRSRKNTFPVIIVLFSIIFNILNGYLNGRYLFYFAPAYDINWLRDPRFITGTAIFFIGYAINIYSDHILRKLRKSNSNEYRIPFGGFFRYISSPNYFGEIIEWIGWAIATWSLAGLAFAVFTIANLAPRAISIHKWYMKNFPDYPQNRKAIIPFIL